ncbi:MAG: hypothetical protein EXQ87_07400 [Alphaproteobacteria bacterium]|nr:hypothetical protein [Alphaproteobacteria bacterium]
MLRKLSHALALALLLVVTGFGSGLGFGAGAVGAGQHSAMACGDPGSDCCAGHWGGGCVPGASCQGRCAPSTVASLLPSDVALRQWKPVRVAGSVGDRGHVPIVGIPPFRPPRSSIPV